MLPEGLKTPTEVLLIATTATVMLGGFRLLLRLAGDVKQLAKPAVPAEASNGLNDPSSWRTSMTAAVTNLSAAVAQIGSKSDALEEDLNDIHQRLSEMRFMLKLLPTREDLAAIAKENRHAAGNDAQKVIAVIHEVSRTLKEAKT